MGQKVNPILFRLGTSSPSNSSWYTSFGLYSQLLSQDLELRDFLFNTLKSRGILLRSLRIRRSYNKIWIDVDLFFSYILTKQAKFIWARSFFKMVKEKYTEVNRIRDLKGFVSFLRVDDTEGHVSPKLSSSKRRYIFSLNTRKKVFCGSIKKKIKKKILLVYKNRLFFFLLLKNRKFAQVKEKEDIQLVSAKQRDNRCLHAHRFIRVDLPKFDRLFVLQKFFYNFRSFHLKKSVPNGFLMKERFDLLELNKNLCQSVQNFCGVEEVQLTIYSNQLNYLPSFKSVQREVFKELSRFQRNREIKKYFVETLETLYFVLRTFGFGNALLVSQLLIFLLENTRNQMGVVRFFKKSLEVFFQLLPEYSRSIDGIKILVKGRFNKRRRTKKVILQQGQISLQTIRAPIDYFQTFAVTIYGSFGIKVWISKR